MNEHLPHYLPCALFVAHPGHELRLHGWISREKPICMTLTTGSRSGNDATRLQASMNVVRDAGGRCPELFRSTLDRDLYQFILAGDATPFHRWKENLADILVSHRIERLVVDGWQLYSVSHDLAHVIGRLAADEASRRLAHGIEILQYEVVPAALAGRVPASPCAHRLLLSEKELAAKLAAIDSYPGIEFELIELRQIEKDDYARTEILFSPPAFEHLLITPDEVPKYESYGEARRSRGIYKHVIRWHHVEAIIKQLISAQKEI